MKSSILIALAFCFCLISHCQNISFNRNDSTFTFHFILKYGIGANVLNTFDQTFTKDLICDSAVSTSLRLTSEELDTIKLEMERVQIFDYPENFAPPLSDHPSKDERIVSPSMEYYFKIQLGNNIKEITWHDTNASETNMAKRLRALVSKIRKIIESKKEYKMLPEPRGAYQ